MVPIRRPVAEKFSVYYARNELLPRRLLGGSYAFTDQFNVSATLYNLFDKDFVDYRAYGDGTSFGNVYANSEEGRRLWLSARYEF